MMTLSRLLDSVPGNGAQTAPGEDPALAWVEARLRQGYRVARAAYHDDGAGPGSGPWVLLALERDGFRVDVPIPLHDQSRRFLISRCAGAAVAIADDLLPVPVPVPVPATSGSDLTAELRDLFRRVEGLEPKRQAGTLLGWILRKTEAARCALVPFDSGIPGPPIAFELRGTVSGPLHPRRLPRRPIESAALLRQPIVAHCLDRDGAREVGGDTAIQQQVQSFIAVPVVFRGDLLGVCYLDRFDRPRPFLPDEQATFEAFAYELARPLLGLREEERRREYLALRDGRLGGRPPRLATSPALAPVLERARRLAPHRGESILVLGETGVGKEVVARLIHEHSGRSARPFVAVNVSALGQDLFESELMGSVAGAFTGAVDRPGRIAAAEGGTLFLDEIGDLPLAHQVRLLRFLQDKRVRPVGGRTERVADVRVIAATNRPIAELVAEGEFRADLLHRFAPPLQVPPLRQRRQEILPHARVWLALKSAEAGTPALALTPAAEEFLLGYPWPGNVRQLETVVAHAALLSVEDAIDRPLLESLVPASPARHGPSRTLGEWRAQAEANEREWLAEALARAGGNVAAAARSLDCAKSTLQSLLARHRLTPPAVRPGAERRAGGMG